jgi:hypothetical protein
MTLIANSCTILQNAWGGILTGNKPDEKGFAQKQTDFMRNKYIRKFSSIHTTTLYIDKINYLFSFDSGLRG